METEPEQLQAKCPPVLPAQPGSAGGGTAGRETPRTSIAAALPRVGVIDSAAKNLQLGELSFRLPQSPLSLGALLQRRTAADDEGQEKLRHLFGCQRGFW